jgi:hypothetical protein
LLAVFLTFGAVVLWIFITLPSDMLGDDFIYYGGHLALKRDRIPYARENMTYSVTEVNERRNRLTIFNAQTKCISFLGNWTTLNTV